MTPNSVTKNIKTTQIKHTTLKARSVKSENSQRNMIEMLDQPVATCDTLMPLW